MNEWVPIFSAGMRPLATILSRIGMETVSTSPMASVMFWIHISCIGSSTGAPCTPILATVPPGRTRESAVRSVSG